MLFFFNYKYNITCYSESMKSIGYKQIYHYLRNKKVENSYQLMIKNAVISTRNLVKKQLLLLKNWDNLIQLDLEKRKKNDILQLINKYLKYNKN